LDNAKRVAVTDSFKLLSVHIYYYLKILCCRHTLDDILL